MKRPADVREELKGVAKVYERLEYSEPYEWGGRAVSRSSCSCGVWTSWPPGHFHFL
jgi:hypothetical protein